MSRCRYSTASAANRRESNAERYCSMSKRQIGIAKESDGDSIGVTLRPTVPVL